MGPVYTTHCRWLMMMMMMMMMTMMIMICLSSSSSSSHLLVVGGCSVSVYLYLTILVISVIPVISYPLRPVNAYPAPPPPSQPRSLPLPSTPLTPPPLATLSFLQVGESSVQLPVASAIGAQPTAATTASSGGQVTGDPPPPPLYPHLSLVPCLPSSHVCHISSSPLPTPLPPPVDRWPTPPPHLNLMSLPFVTSWCPSHSLMSHLLLSLAHATASSSYPPPLPLPPPPLVPSHSLYMRAAWTP